MSAPRPNVLLITLDQWRGDCLSAVGHPVVKTPHIDALAADGTLFRNHYTVASPCGPARASLLTGLYLHNHRSVRNGIPLDRRHITLGDAMADLGYRPTLFGFTDTTLDPRTLPVGDPGLRTFASIAPGFVEGLHLPGDGWAWIRWLEAKGYEVPASPRDMWQPATPGRTRVDDSPPAYAAEDSETAFLTVAAATFIRDQGRTPWFAHVSYFRPHHPYIAPEPYNQMYSPADVPPPVRAATREEEGAQHPWLAAQIEMQRCGRVPVQDVLPASELDDAAIAQLRATYFGSVSECDAMIGRLVAELKLAGVYDRTIIVLTSDHGDMLGDHWLWAAEGYCDQAFHVPLIVCDPSAAPDAARGRTVDAFTESVDIFPTILDLVGAPSSSGIDGHSLRDFLHGGAPADWRTAVHWELDFRDTAAPAVQSVLRLSAEDACLAVVRDNNGKYVHFAGLPPLLFDMKADPHQLTDLSGRSERLADQLAYSRSLLSWRMRSDDHTLTRLFVGPGGVVNRSEGKQR